MPAKAGIFAHWVDAGWFYNHLARLLYAKAVDWKPMDMADLRKYVDSERRAHIVDGTIGEYIFPNWSLYERETQLYVDIAAFDDNKLVWTEPRRSPPIFNLMPSVLQVAEALSAVGALTTRGIATVTEIWGPVEFKDVENDHVSATLNPRNLEGAPRQNAK